MPMAGMLLGGSLYAALRKVLFQLTGPGLNGQVILSISKHSHHTCLACADANAQLRQPPVVEESIASGNLDPLSSAKTLLGFCDAGRPYHQDWVCQVHTFEKPWFTSAEGAMACALCIIPFFWLRRRRRVCVILELCSETLLPWPNPAGGRSEQPAPQNLPDTSESSSATTTGTTVCRPVHQAACCTGN